MVWFGLTVLSAVFVAFDLYTRTPAMSVMKPGWVLVTLYTGPIGLALYLATCRPPQPGAEAHDAYIRPLWRQAAGSTVHCVAGDATGVIVAALIVSRFEVPNGVEVSLEYTFGFVFGLFIFQALFMAAMLGGYWLAVRKTILPEWLSMNMVMAGMIPVMVVMMKHLSAAQHPGQLRYWFVMQLAAIVGYAAAYPINHWMVGKGIKHGMMTQRPKGAPMPAMHMEPREAAHSDHAPMGHMEHKEGQSMPMEHHHEHHAANVTRAQLAAATIISLAFLAVGVWIAWHFAGLSFTAGAAGG